MICDKLIDDDETPLEALKRELREEIDYDPGEAVYFTRLDFDLTELGMRRFYRIYYVTGMSCADRDRIILHEGQAVEAFSAETILDTLQVTPYDAFALFLHHARNRLRDG